MTYGVRLGVRTDTPALAEQIPGLLPHLWTTLTEQEPIVDHLYSLLFRRDDLCVYSNTRICYRGGDVGTALAILEREMKLYVAVHAMERIFLHAGVVGWRGKAIVIPGTSFSGKTTLVSELVRAGATYYSDEFAVLDRRGMVHPYAAPLEVRKRGENFQVKTPVEALGGHAGDEPLRVGLVAITQHENGTTWSPVPLSTGGAVLELLPHTPAMRRKPAATLHTLERAIAGAVVVRGARGDAASTAQMMLHRLPG